MMAKIHRLYETEKERRCKGLASAKHVAPTGDDWTSVTTWCYCTSHNCCMGIKVVRIENNEDMC